MAKAACTSKIEYTKEEMIVLAQLRRSSGRVCRNCQWSSNRGKHRGCFPEGRYRKWLSPEEYEAGCDLFQGKPRRK